MSYLQKIANAAMLGARRARGSGIIPPLAANLNLWYRSDQVVLSGSDVTQVNDLSGFNRHVSQSTESLRPTYNSSNSTFGNQPTIAFDGTQRMFGGLYSPTIAKPATVYTVLQLNETTATRIPIVLDASNADALFSSAGTWRYSWGSFIDSGISSVSGSTVGIAVNFNVDASETSKFYYNDFTTLADESNTGVDAAALDNIYLGSSTTGTGLAIMDFAEILVYAGQHNQTQRNRVRDYLNLRYGLTIT